jgi:hypothetical protein
MPRSCGHTAEREYTQRWDLPTDCKCHLYAIAGKVIEPSVKLFVNEVFFCQSSSRGD